MKSLVLKANQTLKKNRRNNKGFTLVELIIVIAIIAVLAAVLAPQYIRYVERSRYSTDLNAVNEIAHAMEVASVGDGITTPTGDSLTVTTTGDSDYDSVAAGTIGEAYGYIVNKYKGVDRVLDIIENHPEARDNVMSLWYNCHLDKGVLRPCVWSHEVDITNGTLNMYVHQRSCDVPLGLPFNVTQFAALMHLYARVGGYKVGTLSWSIKDAHIYVNQVEKIKELIERGKTLSIYEGYKNRTWLEGQLENYKEEYDKILKTLTKEELINLKKGIVPDVLKSTDLKVKVCDYVLNPPSPELWVNPDVKDFYKFNNDDECKDIKVLNYKDLGKINFPVSE